MDRITPPKELRDTILRSIASRERESARAYVSASFIVAALSIAGLAVSIKHLVQAVHQSSFYQYLSLMFSDPDIVFLFWKEFILSLAESAPLFGMTLVLTTIAVLLLSVRTLIIHKGLSVTAKIV